MKFTIEELQDGIQGLPPEGFFDLDKDNGSPAIFYDFVVDANFQVSIDHYECMDVMVGSSWSPLACIDTLEGINQEIKRGQFSRFRYIVIA